MLSPSPKSFVKQGCIFPILLYSPTNQGQLPTLIQASDLLATLGISEESKKYIYSSYNLVTEIDVLLLPFHTTFPVNKSPSIRATATAELSNELDAQIN